MSILNLQDKKFGKLIASKLTLERCFGSCVWECLCDCGNSIKVPSNRLQSGNTKSCGCLQKETRASLPQRTLANRVALGTELKSLKNKYFYAAKRNPSIRGYSFELTRGQFEEITSKNCTYCNSPPIPKSSVGCYGVIKYNGVDRTDNSKGYTLDNSVSCCQTCNYSKRQMSVEQFISWIKEVYNWSCNGV